MPSPKTLRTVLATGCPTLETLLAHAQRLKRLQDSLDELFPSSVRPHCQAASFQGDHLVLNVSSSIWATRIRYLLPTLLVQLQKNYALARPPKVRIRVSLPRQMEATRIKRPPLSLSRGSSECLQRAATATADPELRSVLFRLACR